MPSHGGRRRKIYRQQPKYKHFSTSSDCVMWKEHIIQFHMLFWTPPCTAHTVKTVKTWGKQQYEPTAKAREREWGRHREQRGHYNSCNLHHFYKLDSLLSGGACKTLASPVLHILIIASIKGNCGRWTGINVYGNGILDWRGQIQAELSMVIALSWNQPLLKWNSW